jgi:hypothetical protein
MIRMHQTTAKPRKDPGARSGNVKTAKGMTLLLTCMLGLVLLMTACTPQNATPPQPTSSATSARTAVPLGPTSTSSPAPTSIPPTSPTPTLFPLPPISDDDWSRGPTNAPAVLLMYADFQ